MIFSMLVLMLWLIKALGLNAAKYNSIDQQQAYHDGHYPYNYYGGYAQQHGKLAVGTVEPVPTTIASTGAGGSAETKPNNDANAASEKDQETKRVKKEGAGSKYPGTAAGYPYPHHANHHQRYNYDMYNKYNYHRAYYQHHQKYPKGLTVLSTVMAVVHLQCCIS